MKIVGARQPYAGGLFGGPMRGPRPDRDGSASPSHVEIHGWEVGAQPVSIRMPIHLIQRLNYDIERGLNMRSPSDVSGVLVGRVKSGIASTIIVDGYQLARYTGDQGGLSIAQDERIKEIVHRLKFGDRQHRVIGFFRSHRREAPVISEEDLKGAKRLAPRGHTIFLLVRSSLNRESTGRFFLRQPKAATLHEEYGEVPFDSGLLLAPPNVMSPNRGRSARRFRTENRLGTIAGLTRKAQPQIIDAPTKWRGWSSVVVMIDGAQTAALDAFDSARSICNVEQLSAVWTTIVGLPRSWWRSIAALVAKAHAAAEDVLNSGFSTSISSSEAAVENQAAFENEAAFEDAGQPEEQEQWSTIPFAPPEEMPVAAFEDAVEAALETDAKPSLWSRVAASVAEAHATAKQKLSSAWAMRKAVDAPAESAAVEELPVAAFEDVVEAAPETDAKPSLWSRVAASVSEAHATAKQKLSSAWAMRKAVDAPAESAPVEELPVAAFEDAVEAALEADAKTSLWSRVAASVSAAHATAKQKLSSARSALRAIRPVASQPAAHKVREDVEIVRAIAAESAPVLAMPLRKLAWRSWAYIAASWTLAVGVTMWSINGTTLFGRHQTETTEKHVAISEPLGLDVDRHGKLLEIVWNGNSETAVHSRSGDMTIRDGDQVTHVRLDSGEIRTGHIYYGPRNTDLSVQLDVAANDGRAASESVQVVNTSATPAQP